ncbi:hypothetical protein GBAR_LOCUS11253 [Geodia barretti]|uniref:Uncharacterized protein n=1 Tax=Geodia barretti TaxID=519541 RepID=A0AA35WLQ6_GEOBA|nr:hypothetical protein GBAR_LOCUS11253 [Geodia barretti]
MRSFLQTMQTYATVWCTICVISPRKPLQ